MSAWFRQQSLPICYEKQSSTAAVKSKTIAMAQRGETKSTTARFKRKLCSFQNHHYPVEFVVPTKLDTAQLPSVRKSTELKLKACDQLYLIVTSPPHPAGVTASLSRTRPTGPTIRYAPVSSTASSLSNRPTRSVVKPQVKGRRRNMSASRARLISKTSEEKRAEPIPTHPTNRTQPTPDPVEKITKRNPRQKSINNCNKEVIKNGAMVKKRLVRTAQQSTSILLSASPAETEGMKFSIRQTRWALALLEPHLTRLRNIEAVQIDQLAAFHPDLSEIAVELPEQLHIDPILLAFKQGAIIWEKKQGKKGMANEYQASSEDVAKVSKLLEEIDQTYLRITGAAKLIEQAHEILTDEESVSDYSSAHSEYQDEDQNEQEVFGGRFGTEGVRIERKSALNVGAESSSSEDEFGTEESEQDDPDWAT